MNPGRVIPPVCLAALLAACVGGNPTTGEKKTQACVSCHGENGVSTNPQFPTLANQHADYLVQALMDYQSGARKNAIMSGFAANLSRRDMEDIAAYYATQRKGLYVK